MTVLIVCALFTCGPVRGGHTEPHARGGHAVTVLETNVQVGRRLARSRGWVGREFDCLYRLWNRESGWRTAAVNRGGSGATGIPQALPGSKMASAGADWRTNAETQIRWGLGYIRARYGSPCGAWANSQAHGWY